MCVFLRVLVCFLFSLLYVILCLLHVVWWNNMVVLCWWCDWCAFSGMFLLGDFWDCLLCFLCPVGTVFGHVFQWSRFVCVFQLPVLCELCLRFVCFWLCHCLCCISLYFAVCVVLLCLVHYVCCVVVCFVCRVCVFCCVVCVLCVMCVVYLLSSLGVVYCFISVLCCYILCVVFCKWSCVPWVFCVRLPVLCVMCVEVVFVSLLGLKWHVWEIWVCGKGNGLVWGRS